ncbi:polyprenyl synthetase family protein [Salinicola rhizosphaerae]|uniref:Farnesyl-diphosphate synthase n=1 Tax=Salinicola rhizosphaerae TaxID=1443141 RepID=A0ABQ3EKD4_9GAMM|nr:polyprenyl synthetase family protein [Salinicola rhizosphaerae]GHB33589.1 farnesyl-diphosphate synthase [Salinicola rhizosphaerae]
MASHAADITDQEEELARLRERIQGRLDQLLPQTDQRDLVSAAMRESALAPGKRIRPLLMMLTARDLGCVQHPGLLDLACAVEMVHAASLVLDDLPCMDDAQLRRGRPTIHRRFGENVAILAAVALLSGAFGVIANAAGLSDTQRTRAVDELSRAVGQQGLVRGQFLDLSEGNATRSLEAIADTNELKTSVLFGATLQLAAIAAEATEAAGDALRGFARDLGQAFQLLDDLADGRSDTGKDVAQDLGKSTLVAMLGSDAVHQRLREHLKRAEVHFAHACGPRTPTQAFMHAWFERQLNHEAPAMSTVSRQRQPS